MTEQAAQAAVDQACRALRLPTIRTRAEDRARRLSNRSAIPALGACLVSVGDWLLP